jgi:hypothetical protein
MAPTLPGVLQGHWFANKSTIFILLLKRAQKILENDEMAQLKIRYVFIVCVKCVLCICLFLRPIMSKVLRELIFFDGRIRI